MLHLLTVSSICVCIALVFLRAHVQGALSLSLHVSLCALQLATVLYVLTGAAFDLLQEKQRARRDADVSIEREGLFYGPAAGSMPVTQLQSRFPSRSISGKPCT